ncbi:c-type cytochrome [Hansschlegelia beijingensis]|uniref:Cytochrome c n=1 Tax=Hansschlegelia beijingensis TaxID=1133344 RepID=A0A7W6CYT9_9HYPH|nr:cytochrome c [Hansschlegelia beijingensis]MBB3972832.1 cytochrome c [Hansschlegelia beijingensis]
MSVKTIVAGLFVGSALFAAPALAGEGPFTADQVKKGLTEYNTHCRTCHAKDGKGALGPALHGDTFKSRFGGQSWADIRTWIHDNMPQTAPGTLSDDQLNVLTAYTMSLNGYTPGQTELSADTAKTVTLEK